MSFARTKIASDIFSLYCSFQCRLRDTSPQDKEQRCPRKVPWLPLCFSSWKRQPIPLKFPCWPLWFLLFPDIRPHTRQSQRFICNKVYLKRQQGEFKKLSFLSVEPLGCGRKRIPHFIRGPDDDTLSLLFNVIWWIFLTNLRSRHACFREVNNPQPLQ